MKKLLNQEEIDAMFLAARGGAATAARNVQGWDPTRFRQLGASQLQTISQLHEGFAQQLTHSLGAYLQVGLDAKLVSAEYLAFTEFLQRLPEQTYLAALTVSPLISVALLQLDLTLAFPVIDLLLGGQGVGEVPARDLTEIEAEILESVVTLICRQLTLAWEALQLTFTFEQRKRTAEAQRLMAPEEKTLALSFELTVLGARGTLNLILPTLLSNTYLRKLASEKSYVHHGSSPETVRHLRQRVLPCPFLLELAFPRLRVPLDQLLALAPGDVLPLPVRLDRPAVLRVGEEVLFLARPVRQSGLRSAHLLVRPQDPRRSLPA
jgi:flagellar motor switch protein FliM